MPFVSASENPMPRHVAIIMDGNGRWATKRALPRTAGHKEGLESAKRIVRAAADIGIKYVTLYTFSTENWKRTQEEVGYLMGLIKIHLRAEFAFYKENQIRVTHIGDLSGLPSDVREEIQNAKKDTEHFTGTTVVLAINYGSRDEILRASKKLLASISGEKNGPHSIADITESGFEKFFDFPEAGDIDLLIRTGGEKRLSNFLLWQAAYAEFVFSPTLWPDYSVEEFNDHIRAFAERDRRFGGVKGE